MSLPSFETNQLKSRRKAIIDGHEFTIRRFGNIERLEVMRLQQEVEKIIKKYPADAKDEDISQEDIDEINSKAMQSSELLIRLFDDGGDQSKSRDLIRSLEDTEIIDIIDSIFEQTNNG